MPKTNTVVTSAIERAAKLQAEQRRQAEEAAKTRHAIYLDLLSRAHADKVGSPEEVLEILDRCGESIDLLQGNLTQLAELSDKVERLTQQPTLRKRQQAIRREQDETKAEMERLEKLAEDLGNQETSVAKRLNEISQLRHELRRLLPSEISNDVRDIEGQIRDAQA